MLHSTFAAYHIALRNPSGWSHPATSRNIRHNIPSHTNTKLPPYQVGGRPHQSPSHLGGRTPCNLIHFALNLAFEPEPLLPNEKHVKPRAFMFVQEVGRRGAQELPRHTNYPLRARIPTNFLTHCALCQIAQPCFKLLSPSSFIFCLFVTFLEHVT
jgi:hypothetical protein